MKNRKRRLLQVSIAVSLLLLSSVLGSGAAERTACGKDIAGTKRLLLFAKNPSSWKIIKGGAKGIMIYREETGKFTLTANGLSPRSPYAIVRYAGTPPTVEILIRGASDDRGKIGLSGSWGNWTGKFWLVAGDDVEGGSAGRLINWRPRRYLFEEKPLGGACARREPEVRQ